MQEASAAAAALRRGRLAEGVAHDRDHPAGDRPPAVGPGPAGAVPRHLAARAAVSPTPRPAGRAEPRDTCRWPCSSCWSAVAGRARRLRAARRVRLRLRGDRRDRRQESEANCRQLAAAPAGTWPSGAAVRASRVPRDELARRFLAAVEAGERAAGRAAGRGRRFYGDGGGKAPAIGKPVYRRRGGRPAAARLPPRARAGGIGCEPTEVNGQPGLARATTATAA